MMLVKNRILLAKLESSYGSDASPVVGTDAIDCRNVKRDFIGDILERDLVRGNISPFPAIVGKHYATISFDVELKGSGSAGVAGQLSALLQACAMSEAVSAGSSVVYSPLSANQKSLTLYLYDLDSGSAVLHKITGAMGTFNAKMTAGTIGLLSFSFQGIWNTPTAVALPSTPTYESSTPPVIESAAFSINGVSSLVVKEVSIDLANTIVERDDISAATGIKSFFISARKPKGSFPIEAVLPGTYDIGSEWVASQQRALSITVGTVAGNRVSISAPKVVLETVKDADENSVLKKDVGIMFGQNVGNDEVVLTFS